MTLGDRFVAGPYSMGEILAQQVRVVTFTSHGNISVIHGSGSKRGAACRPRRYRLMSAADALCLYAATPCAYCLSEGPEAYIKSRWPEVRDAALLERAYAS